MGGVLVGCYTRAPQTGWLRNSSSGDLRSGSLHSGVLVRTLFLLQMADSAVSSRGGRAQGALRGPFYEGTNPFQEALPS